MGKYTLILCLITFLISCSRQVVYEADTKKPVIRVDYPTDNPVINGDDPLCIKVSISDDKSLANIWLQVNDVNGFRKDYAITGRSFDLIEKYTAPSGNRGNLIAKFFATDEAGNMSSEEIKFAVNN